ncbi:hypothetical protein CVS28_04250 [Arthrobacter glacialis]|nr:hypothetical protein [Arthrobacter glacialis]POH60163.1 hypothetical protein CVS28_04250 [Arthrobacter glacialis]
MDSTTDIHWHTSHLFAVYPGRQSNLKESPELAAVALVSLKVHCGEVEAIGDKSPNQGNLTVSTNGKNYKVKPTKADSLFATSEPA